MRQQSTINQWIEWKYENKKAYSRLIWYSLSSGFLVGINVIILLLSIVRIYA